MNETYVKLFTKFLEWEWYDDANTMRVFLHLLLKAGLQDTRWHGVEVKRGQVIISIRKLSKELHLTDRKIRTALSHLESTHETTQQTTQSYTLITICKYDSYNGVENSNDTPNDTPNDTLNDTPTTHHRHTNDTPLDSQIQLVKESLETSSDTPSVFSDKNNNNSNNIYNNIYKEKEKEKEKEKVSLEKIQANLEKRQQEFYNELVPYVDEFGKQLLREFYDYWSEPTPSKKKFRKEMQRTWDTHRRLLTWQRNNDKTKQYGTTQQRDIDIKRRSMEVTATCAEDYGDL